MPQTGQRGGAPVPCAPCVADAVQGEHRMWPHGARDESESRLRDEGEAVLAESGVRHDEHARWASGSGPCIEHSSVRLLSESGSGGQRRASSSSSPLLSLVLLISSSTRHGSTLSRSCQGLAVRCTARPPRRHPRVLDRPHPVPLLVAPLAQALEPDRLLVRPRVVAQDPRHPRSARPPRRRQALAPRRRPPPRAPPLGLGRPPLVARRHHCAHLVLTCSALSRPKADPGPTLATQAELVQSSDLVPRSTYLSSPAPQAYGVASLLARPFWWGLSKVWGSSDAVELGEGADEKEWARRKGDYVLPDLVEVRLFPAALALCAVDGVAQSAYGQSRI